MEKRSGTQDVKPFSFTAFEDAAPTSAGFAAFEFQDLSGTTAAKRPSAKIIRAEREAESKSKFRIDDVVRDLRGLSSQERDDLEARIATEVEKRMAQTKDAAYREGLEKGRMEGADAALREAMARHEEQLAAVEEMIEGLRQQSAARLEAQRSDIYEMTKRLVKWLVLKEVRDDSYLPKLLERMILEMNQRQNLIVRVHPDDFAGMPELLGQLEKRLGTLTNVRFEPDLEMQGRGIVLETENGILDARPEALFQTIDKMYEAVVNHE